MENAYVWNFVNFGEFYNLVSLVLLLLFQELKAKNKLVYLCDLKLKFFSI